MSLKNLFGRGKTENGTACGAGDKKPAVRRRNITG